MKRATAYFFDVDGVLTDPVKKIVPEELINQLKLRLEKDFLVGINTGRSNNWLEKRLIKPLLEQIKVKEKLFNFIVVGEKGGTWLSFDGKGKMQRGKKDIAVKPELKEAVIKTVAEKYSQVMFVDTTKETMISLEMQDHCAQAEFLKVQTALIADLEKILIATGCQKTFKIDPSEIATDIESVEVGKGLGAKLLLKFLVKKELRPERFVAFGDSRSDFAMADELKAQGKEVAFIYTGKKNIELPKDYPTVLAGGYSQGTLEYLEKEWTE